MKMRVLVLPLDGDVLVDDGNLLELLLAVQSWVSAIIPLSAITALDTHLYWIPSGDLVVVVIVHHVLKCSIRRAQNFSVIFLFFSKK